MHSTASHSDIGRWDMGQKPCCFVTFFFPVPKGGSNRCREVSKDSRPWCQVVYQLLVGAHRALSRLTEPLAVLTNASSLLDPVKLRMNAHRALSSLLELPACGAELSPAKAIRAQQAKPRPHRAVLAPFSQRVVHSSGSPPKPNCHTRTCALHSKV